MRKFKATRKRQSPDLGEGPFCCVRRWRDGIRSPLIPAHRVALVRIVLCDSAQKLIQLARDCKTKGSWPFDGRRVESSGRREASPMSVGVKVFGVRRETGKE